MLLHMPCGDLCQCFPGEWKLPDAGDRFDRDLSHRASKKISLHCCSHWKAVGSFARFFACVFSRSLFPSVTRKCEWRPFLKFKLTVNNVDSALNFHRGNFSTEKISHEPFQKKISSDRCASYILQDLEIKCHLERNRQMSVLLFKLFSVATCFDSF